VTLPAQEAFCQALATDSEAQYQAALRQQQGIAAPAVMRRFLEAQGLPADDELVEAAAEAYCRGGPDLAAPLRTGAVETLAALKSRGLLLGAISNTIQPGRFLTNNMHRWGLNQLFDARVYSSDVGVAKPHPQIFRVALEQLGVAAPDAVYVGDRLVPDVGGAQAVGMKAVLIEVTHRVETHPTIVPDARIKELPELCDVLPGLF
jgi:HAD superfamily hydrolase (TIGR01509 family)